MEKLNYLIEYLLGENSNIRLNEIPNDENSKRKLYRSLCNIREPLPISQKYIKIENEYLQEELEKKIRKDANFVQDENWYKQSKKYEEFLNCAKNKNVVLFEIGVRI